jgi:hypothetical protein
MKETITSSRAVPNPIKLPTIWEGPHYSKPRARLGVNVSAQECARVLLKSPLTWPTALGTLVTTVDRFNWSEYGGLKYWVGSESPSIPADQCECKAGDLISWFGAAG